MCFVFGRQRRRFRDPLTANEVVDDGPVAVVVGADCLSCRHLRRSGACQRFADAARTDPAPLPFPPAGYVVGDGWIARDPDDADADDADDVGGFADVDPTTPIGLAVAAYCYRDAGQADPQATCAAHEAASNAAIGVRSVVWWPRPAGEPARRSEPPATGRSTPPVPQRPPPKPASPIRRRGEPDPDDDPPPAAPPQKRRAAG